MREILKKKALALKKRLLRITHKGMPPIGLLRRRISRGEKIPEVLFYIPLFVHWILLGAKYRSLTLPTAANPYIETGGFWGESKSGCMGLLSAHKKWLAPYTTLQRPIVRFSADRDLSSALIKKIKFPLVAKPDIGWRGYGVQLIHAKEDLCNYIESFPPGETMILQEYIPYEGEAGVFYVRMPGHKYGKLISMTFRYFPHVVGDGKKTVRQLILDDSRARWKAQTHFGSNPKHTGVADLDHVPEKGEIFRLCFIGSNRVGGLYRDARRYITPKLTKRFDEIVSAIPEFYIGRFDIRFSSIEKLQKGLDFKIIEINGSGSESINVWDPEKRILDVFSTLFRQQEMMFKIGSLNRKRGFKPVSLLRFFHYLVKQRSLIQRYPPSS
jgi:hypothetical protein